MERITDIIESKLIPDETYLVPHVKVIHTDPFNKSADKYYPVYPHLHNDAENGQEIPHYHIDHRIATTNAVQAIRIEVGTKGYTVSKIEYLPAKFLGHKHGEVTSVNLLSNSIMNVKNLNRNRCPHRGYDLSKIVPDENDVITCPLHSLKICKHTNKILNHNGKIK